MRTICWATILAVASANADWPEIHESEIWHFEPGVPVLSADRYNPVPGFRGRAARLEQINSRNAAGDETEKTWRAVAWRNERVHGQFVVWTGEPLAQVRCELKPFVDAAGRTWPCGAAQTRFVRYVRGGLLNWRREMREAPAFVGDCLDPIERIDLPVNGFRPVWLTVIPPKDAAPGLCRSTLVVHAEGGKQLEFPLELVVVNRTLPDPRNWKIHVDLLQHPWAIARYHGVEPFSEEHYRLMRPYCEALAEVHARTITCTLVDLPWNHQSYDAYHSMVRHVRHADGTWSHDYSILDGYVAFALSCGVGPQIHCYSLVPWGNVVAYEDERSGDVKRMALAAGSAEHSAFWGPFMSDFEQHMKKMGWAQETFIALDERSPDEMLATVDLVRQHAPSFRIQMGINRMPDEFKGIEIDSCCQAITRITDAFLASAQKRREEGRLTTYYACCSPDRPNTFLTSPMFEGRWFGLFAARGLDGFCRWAVWNWTKDPFDDVSFGGDDGNWMPGDPYLLYPGPRSSTRWEMLRDGFENFEKIRLLRESGETPPELEQALKSVDYDVVKKLDDRATESAVTEVERILNATK